MDDQRRKAEDFRALHHGERPLVLANVWDAGSAVLTASLGFPALATTSAGVAWALGQADGENLTRDEMLGAVARIARRVDLPLSADMERGYGETAEAVAETVRRTIEAGAVGINLEDGIDHAKGTMRDPKLAAEIVAAARAAGDAAGVPLVVNARTDVYFDRAAAPEAKFRDAVARANAYIEAGADCAFVIAVNDADAIAGLVREIAGPVNVVAGAGGLDVNGLAELGVKRISLAGAMTRVAYGALRDALVEIRDGGSLGFLGQAPSHPELNQLFEVRHRPHGEEAE